MHKHRVIPLWLALAVVVIVAGIAGALIYRQYGTSADQASLLSKLQSENRDLRGKTARLEQDLEAARHGLAAPRLPEGAESEHHRREQLPRPDDGRMVVQLRRDLDAANNSIDQLQAHIHELEASVNKLTEENKRLAIAEVDLRERLASTNRVLEAVQTELKGKTDRIIQLETTNRMLFDQNKALNDKASRSPRLLQDLDEINKRREATLTSILRRYRDVTDQYRTLSARLENARENNLPGGPELDRIQNTISLAEDDLRQLAGLNSQANRLQQKLMGR